MRKRFAGNALAALLLAWLTCLSGAIANSHSGSGGGATTPNDVLISNNLNPATYTPQVILLLNYGGNPISLTDITAQPHSAIQLYNTSRQPVNGAGVGSISYFHLPTNHTARFQNYSTSNPFWVSLWCPVDSSSNGQLHSTTWFSDFCFGFPQTQGASKKHSTPAGTTLVEPKLLGQLGDTIDISEVNGVNAQWKVHLPNQGWCSGAFRNGSIPPNYPQIQWSTIMNQPGSGATYYGDYGNPGVFPFGCTTCVSRYNNGVLAAGCQNSTNNFFNYPSADVGCDNAINPQEPTFISPPPGVASLPTDRYYPHILYNPGSAGYGICQLSPSAGNPVVKAGGTVQITLLQYPFGQVQASDTASE